ncbi:MoaD/ThiS family protein [Algoriphagus namhaensis]
MKIRFNYHGKLVELLGTKSEELELPQDTSAEIRQTLIQAHPELAESTFQLAQSNRILQAGDLIEEKEIDVFPPFSGG